MTVGRASPERGGTGCVGPDPVTSESGSSARLQGKEQTTGKKCPTLLCTVFVYALPEEPEITTDNLEKKLLKQSIDISDIGIHMQGL